MGLVGGGEEGRPATIAYNTSKGALIAMIQGPDNKTYIGVEVVKDGAGLRCGQCRRVYPVRDDIPIMLPEEATVEP